MWRSVVRALFIALVFASSASADSSSPSANRWTVQFHSGDVSVSSVGATDWRTPEPGQVLSAPFHIRTGATGEMILLRGEDTLLVSPESRIEVRAVEHSPDIGLVTRIQQAVGSLVYQVEKRSRQRFEVHTPYLVSVVKGTTFTISVTEHDTSVSLNEGSLEVLSKDGLHRALLKPGEIARHEKGMGAIRVSDGTLKQSQWGAWHPANARHDTAGDKRSRPDVSLWRHAPHASGTAPGRSGTAPGRSGIAPGRSGTAPGRSGTAPGRSGTAPGRSGIAPGRSGTAPGRSGIAPGRSGMLRGRSGMAPGRSGIAPGKNK